MGTQIEGRIQYFGSKFKLVGVAPRRCRLGLLEWVKARNEADFDGRGFDADYFGPPGISAGDD